MQNTHYAYQYIPVKFNCQTKTIRNTEGLANNDHTTHFVLNKHTL
jgi:hypothetical protein